MFTSNDYAEAFKSLNESLCEAEFNLTDTGVEEIKDYLKDDKFDSDVTVYDLDADTADELDSDNVGKIILQCPCCETVVMKAADEIELPEDSEDLTEATVLVDEQCPVCFSELGYKIIGKVAPYEETTIEIEKKDQPETEEKSVEISDEDIEAAKSLLAEFDIDCEDCAHKVAEATKAIGETAVKDLIEMGMPTEEENTEDSDDKEEAEEEVETEEAEEEDDELEESLTKEKVPAFMKKSGIPAGEKASCADCEGNVCECGTSENCEKEEYLCDTDIKDDKEEKNESYTSSSMEDDFKEFVEKWGDYICDLEKLLDLWKKYGLNDKESSIETNESLEEDTDEINAILSTDKKESLDELFGFGKKNNEPDWDKLSAERENLPWWRVTMSNGKTCQAHGKDEKDAMDWCTKYEADRSGARAVSAKPFKSNSNESLTEDANDIITIKDFVYDDDFESATPEEIIQIIKDEYYVDAKLKPAPNDKKWPYRITVTGTADNIYDLFCNTYGFSTGDLCGLEGLDPLVDKLFNIESKKDKTMSEGLNDVLLETDTDKISIHAEAKNNGDEMIAPLDFQSANEIVDAQPVEEDTEYLNNVETEDEPVDDLGEDMPEDVSSEELPEDNIEEADVDIEDIDEEKLDQLGESFFTSSFNNVKSYKTESITEKDNKLICEGILTFESGSQKKTQFILEGNTINSNGNCSFLCENALLTPGQKAIQISGNLKGTKFIPESLSYNYKHNGVDFTGSVNTH